MPGGSEETVFTFENGILTARFPIMVMADQYAQELCRTSTEPGLDSTSPPPSLSR